MSRTSPKVSVVITSYNHSAFIAQAVQSVLDQSFQDFEIIVVDDASTDDSLAVLRGFADPRMSVEALTRNHGPSASANRGIDMATGAYVALLASDDWALPERLQRQVEFLDHNRQISTVLSIPQLVDERGEPLPDTPTSTKPLGLPDLSRATLLAELFWGNFLWPSSAMIRRDAFASFGTFDPRLTNLQDFDLFVRMLLAGHELHVLSEKLTAYRILDGGRNLSAPRMDSVLRSSSEHAIILRHYLTLASPFFEEVFGRVIAERGIAPRPLPQIQLVDIALMHPSTPHRSFALETLHNYAIRGEDYDRLRELSGTLDVFGVWTIAQLSARVAELEQAAMQQTAVIARIKAAIEER